MAGEGGEAAGAPDMVGGVEQGTRATAGLGPGPGIVDDGMELGDPFAVPVIARIAGQAAAGAADEALSQALRQWPAGGHCALPGSGCLVRPGTRAARRGARASSSRATRTPSAVSW